MQLPENTPLLIHAHEDVLHSGPDVVDPPPETDEDDEGVGVDSNGEDVDVDANDEGVDVDANDEGVGVDANDEGLDVDQIMGLDSTTEHSEINHRGLDATIYDDCADRDNRIANYSGNAPLADIQQRVRETGVDDAVYSTFLDEFSTRRRRPDPEPGTLNLRQANRMVCGDTTVDPYDEWHQVGGGDVAVGVSIDMSGSMGEYEVEAKSAVGAFLTGVELFGGDVVANAWQGRGQPKCYLVTGPDERFRWPQLNVTDPGSADPIAAGMLHCAGLLDQLTAETKLLLVVHDGKPTVLSRPDLDEDTAPDEARETVRELRDEGIIVVGVGFGRVNEGNLAKMFGFDDRPNSDGYVHTRLEDLADELVETYSEQIDSEHPTAI